MGTDVSGEEYIACVFMVVTLKQFPVLYGCRTWFYDILAYLNCSWVDTRWQQYSTHLHTNSTQNTENGTYIKIKKFKTNLGNAGRIQVLSWGKAAGAWIWTIRRLRKTFVSLTILQPIAISDSLMRHMSVRPSVRPYQSDSHRKDFNGPYLIFFRKFVDIFW
jgi:hypothetical protein